MIIVHLENLMRKKAYEDKRKINLNIVAKETGISFPTLHNIVNKKNNSTSTAILDKLCKYFDCEILYLLEYQPNSEEWNINILPSAVTTQNDVQKFLVFILIKNNSNSPCCLSKSFPEKGQDLKRFIDGHPQRFFGPNHLKRRY